MIQNEDRIRELVRKTKLLDGKNYANDNSRPSYLYQTQNKTLIPNSNKDLNYYLNNSFNNNLYSTLINDVINKAFGNEKYDFSINHNRVSTFNTINVDSQNTFKTLNDPNILRLKEQETFRRESDRIKVSSLLNRYGMDSKSSYNYNFI